MEKELDLSVNEESPVTVQESFDRIAKDLMENWILVAGENKYRLSEIEFYYHSRNHLDPYVHRNERQLTSHEWYVHPKSRGYGGIDITFGNGNNYGGILIRSIVNVDTCQPVNRPYTSIVTILADINLNYDELMIQTLRQNIYQWDTLKLIHRSTINCIACSQCIKGPRVGISINNQNWREFLFKTYRYIDSYFTINYAHSEKYLFLLYNLQVANQINNLAYLENCARYNNVAPLEIRQNFDRTTIIKHIAYFNEGWNHNNGMINNNNKSVLLGYAMNPQH